MTARRLAAASLLLALALALNLELERRARVATPRHALFMPSGRYLRHASLGFRSLLADLLYVWSIQYYSVERRDRWRWIAPLYDVITDLDPRFEAAYVVGALILALEAGRPDQSLELIEKGMRRLPDRYLLPWEAGFYARDLGQRERSVAFFERASLCRDAPAFARRRYSAVLDQVGRPGEALRAWREVLAAATTDIERGIAERHVLQLELNIQIGALRERIAEFERRSGRRPRGLEELVRAGLLAELPLDPAGQPIGYDPESGKLRAASWFLGRRKD